MLCSLLQCKRCRFHKQCVINLVNAKYTHGRNWYYLRDNNPCHVLFLLSHQGWYKALELGGYNFLSVVCDLINASKQEKKITLFKQTEREREIIYTMSHSLLQRTKCSCTCNCCYCFTFSTSTSAWLVGKKEFCCPFGL